MGINQPIFYLPKAEKQSSKKKNSPQKQQYGFAENKKLLRFIKNFYYGL
jgi:hypothetical protein